ncbi:PQQ-binding-like beta-propeller repeat protein [Urbifossiella limnaea]|uniref:Quinohemoprotein alcohol dehydrogenase ADH-IIG n=1 Tax=Urbifossiella limnaea TaxID=2528023 RepID=A0A517Y1K7_9BACT|nr:PQQ-binding-like beta-propeller repeat protein [Urbifossiella limnaea]QDU23659.1 Quinohemoprotein alcohol dehydrogenase ADH-IIG precursor [Urbifossiella limnaea]
MTRFPAALVLALVPALLAADWPQFLGPTRDNQSPEKIAPWTGTPKTLWKQPVGESHSSPVVANGLVYAFYQPKGKDADALAAFDAATGEKKWEQSYARAAFSPPFGNGPRGTPAIVDGKAYTLGGTGVLACWDAADGKVLWQVDTLKEYKAPNLSFGVSGSPLVSGGKVFVNVGGKGAGVAAFDAATGKLAWKATDDKASYSSPVVADVGGAKQVVFLTAAGLAGFDPDTGKEGWRYPFRDLLQESATSPLVKNGVVYGSSVTLGSVALKLGGAAPTKAWAAPQLNCYFSTPAFGKDGETLFMLNGKLSINPKITLRAVDAATGQVRWEKPDVGKYHAALVVGSDGNVLMLDDGGSLSVFSGERAAFRELCRAKVCGPTWAHPALADGRVFLRDETELVCVSIR